jgi:predicted phage gp36 major capsid-like protein
MNRYGEKFQSDLDRLTKDIQERGAVYARHIPDFPFAPAYMGYTAFYSPWVEFAYDRRTMAALRQFMTEQGWALKWEITEAEVKSSREYPRQMWVKEGVNETYPFDAELFLAFNDHQAGSVCVRKQIGVKSVEQPIYDFTCTEAQGGS